MWWWDITLSGKAWIVDSTIAIALNSEYSDISTLTVAIITESVALTKPIRLPLVLGLTLEHHGKPINYFLRIKIGLTTIDYSKQRKIDAVN
jgi:hypothetical protein